jgi:LmbE family N-acetylglucosaminyl deacetylase
MQDRQTEQRYHPREMLSLEGISSVLCVAPHPDDEVLGCGGLLALLQAQKAKIQVLVLTKGELGQAHLQDQAQSAPESVSHTADSLALAHVRVQESMAAALVLGLPKPKFLNFNDRHLGFTQAITQAIADQIKAQPIDLLLLPSLSDPHPDHQATALAGLAAVQNALQQAKASGQTEHSKTKAAQERPLQILFYEVGAPLHANAFVDFTSVAPKKWAAVQSFQSQLSEQKYESLSRSMAAMRAFGLNPECIAAEAFFKVDMQAFMREGALAAMPQWPWVRHSLGLANAPEQMPLVSVLVRSMNRDCLPQALASVALQTYSNIELVVVNAKGGMHRPLNFVPQTLPCRLLNAQNDGSQGLACAPLGRPEAANMALQNAQGQLAIFLDDDDFFHSEHIAQLVSLLQDNPQAVGAYSGVRVDDQDGNTLREYNLPWSRQRLLAINFLPIHAVLFKMGAVKQQGISFKPALEVLEDWDFWLQLTQTGSLVHSNNITAVYRQALGKSELGSSLSDSHWKSWHHKILEQFVSQSSAQENVDVLSWYALELDKQVAQSAAQELLLKKQITQLLAQADLDKGQIAQEMSSRRELQEELELFSAQIREVLSQKELEIQSHAQELTGLLADKERQLHAQSQEHITLLSEKERQLQAHSAELRGLLSDKERQFQAYAFKAKNALDTKELEKQSLALQMQAVINQKENQLQTFAAEVQKILDSKDVEKQTFALQMQEIINQKESQLEAIAADVQKTLDAKALESRELAASMIASVSGSILKADAIHQEVTAIELSAMNHSPTNSGALSQHLADPHLAKLQQLIELQNQRTETLQIALRQAQSSMSAQSQEIALLRRSLELVYASKSWRFTAPLRASRKA